VVYLDSSALLKLLWDEPESDAVRRQVGIEAAVIISSLAELEAEVQLSARRLAGHYGAARWHRFRAQLAEFRATDPFRFRLLPGTVFQAALRQVVDGGPVHCQTLDRLHLAAMTELDLTRLMTHDEAQANAARALGFDVSMPGRTGERDG
jgi:predicted nucleic acid-binding protein